MCMPGLLASIAAATGQTLPEGLRVEGTAAGAAAWLLRGHRRSLHQAGAVDFDVPKGKSAPRWFLVAIDHLRRRAKWRVMEMATAFKKVYRVVWGERGRYLTGGEK